MTEKASTSADFARIWKAALAEFQANTKRDLANENELSHLQNINGVLEYLTGEQAQYKEDSASSKFTNVVKSTLGPLKLLLGTGGKAAGDMFPGGSQVLSALSIFVEAGKAVTDSFEAVAKLFERIANFASRMQTVSEAKIPPKLVPIYQTMLVSLLNICGLSISITSRYLVTEEEVPEKSSWHRNSEMKALKRNVRKFIRAPHANVKEYLKQLTGGNSKINDAVDNLNELVTFESSMMQAVTLKEVMGIKTFTMNLQGLTIELGKTMSNMQSESNFRLSHIQQSQDRMEENTIDLKKGQSQANTKLDSLQLSMEKLGRMINGVTGKQLNEPQDTKDSVSKERKRWEKLAAALEVEGAKESNKTFYERIRKERVPGTTEWIQDHEAVKSWIQGETPFVVMSGDTGNGKTFIASRIIDQLITSTTNPDKALAYFFCRRGSRERSSVIMALKTMAYDIASSDQLFAKYLMDLVADRKLQSARTAIKVDLTSTTSDLLDSNDVTIESTAITHDQIEAIEAVSDSIPAKLDALSDGGFEPTHSTEDNDIDLEPKLHRVSTAILQDKPLDNSFEEMTVWDVQRHWENLFVSRPQSFERHVYLVVDGLDECDETEAIALCAAISVSADAATSRVATKVHVLLLMNTDRVTRFESHALTSAIIVDVDPDTISTDIDKFVRHRITSAWQEKLVRRELRQESHGAVVANCDANFLKASLLVNEVTSFTREDVIRGTISNLPSLAKTVQSAMLLVIKRLANQLMFYDREDFHDILAWVSCARRELSLAELDALLTLRTQGGARILDLEEKLRETFAALFSVTGEKIFEQKTSDQLMSSHLGFISSTLVYKDVMSIKVAIEDPPGSPIVQTSTLQETVDPETIAVRRATVNLGKNYVSLSHTMIAEQIQKHIARAGLMDFTTVSMQAMVLLRCIDTLCEDPTSHDERSVKLAMGYCGIYLPEHLQSVEPLEVADGMKTKIAKGLIILLRNPVCNARWVESGERYLADDLLGKPDFLQRVLAWLEDSTVQSHLSDDEREWHSRAIKFPVATMLEGVARAVAYRWLVCLEGFCAYADYYGFLKTYQDTKDVPGPIRASSEAPSRALQSASTKDILHVAESTGLQQNCRWYQRLGATIRVERNDYPDNEQFNSTALDSESEVKPRVNLTYDDATHMYCKALEIDSSDSFARSGKARTLAAQEKYEDAAREARTAVGILSAAIQNGEKSPNPEHSLVQYKIDTQQEYASYCIKAGNFDEGFLAYECATDDLATFDTTGDAWEEMALTTAWYFFDLISNKRWGTAGSLLARLNSHPQRSSDAFHVIYQCIAYNESQLLRFGYHTRDLAPLIEFMNHALSSTARQDTDAAVANVVDTFAHILLRLDKERGNDAVMILEALVSQSHMDEFTKSRAERDLARHFLTSMLHDREVDRWQDVAENVDKLIRLANGGESATANFSEENEDCRRILAACYRINGLQKRAEDCVRSDVTLGIDLLSDTDPDNDLMAWHTLMDSLLAIGDTKGAVAAVNMLRNSLLEDPKPSNNNSDGARPHSDSSEKSDGNTQAGASNEISGKSRDILNDDVMTLGPFTSTDRPRTVNASSVEPSSTNQMSTVHQVQQINEPSTCNESNPAAMEDIANGNDRADQIASSSVTGSTLRAGYPFFSCDGCCFDLIPNNAPMWRCSYCIADFCERCRELIKDNKMTGWNVCDSLHQHVSVPGITKKYAKDMIRVEDADKSVVEWVQDLREEWKYFKPGS